MAYFIRWRFSASARRIHSSEPLPTEHAAIEEACVLLRAKTYELWIENSEGHRIEAHEIRRRCGQWGQRQLLAG